MRINQRCSGCQSIYSVGAQQYATLKMAYCPACGHPNPKHPACSEKANRKAAAVIDASGISKIVSSSSASTRNRAGYKGPDHKEAQPLEKLRRAIEEKGKVFILGDGPEVQEQDLQLLRESEIPVIGVRNSYRQFRHLDALLLTDYEETVDNLPEIEKWTDGKKGRFIFWQRTMVGESSDPDRVRGIGNSLRGVGAIEEEEQRYTWKTRAGVHGISVDLEGEAKCERRLNFKYANVQYFDPQESFVKDLEVPLRLSGEDAVDSAINLAYLFGAREIILLGIEEGPHFWEGQEGYQVRTCTPGEKNYLQFESAISTEVPIYLERLYRKIAMTGKVFILGTAPSLDQLPLQKIFGFPVIGTNAAFQKFPHLDALCFGDSYFADKWHDRLKIWQELREEKPVLFWQNYGGGSDLYRVFAYTKGQPNRPIYENIPGRINPIFALKHSIITAAINCAYYLGAKEIYLLGVEFGPGHFYDPDGQIYKDLGKVHDRFPHVEKIVPFIARQKEDLAEKGVTLATCWGGDSAIKDILPFVGLEEAADGRYLTQLFGG